MNGVEYTSNVKLDVNSDYNDSHEIAIILNDEIVPGDQKGLFKLAIQLRKFFNSVIYNTATGYVLLVYLTNI
jgi:hypothetical protein